MVDDGKIGSAQKAGQKTRRAFVKSAAQVAVTAPAVGLLLSASTKAQAAEPPYSNPGPLGDDFNPPGDFLGDLGGDALGDDFAP